MSSLLNVILWSLSAFAILHGRAGPHGAASLICGTQLFLSAMYVFACAYRSALPVYDIPRIVLVRSWLSSVLVGRSVATIGELCFAAQWALILHRVGLVTGSPFAVSAAQVIVPLILIAEAFSWHAVLTTWQQGHVIENSIWGLSAVLVIVGMLLSGPARVTPISVSVIAWCTGGFAYVLFMFLFDVPMYWKRWRDDQASGRPYLTLAQGIVDARRSGEISYRWEDWKSEVVWMSLYFTFGVWSSISIIYACLALEGQG